MPEIAEVRIIADNISDFLLDNQITKIEIQSPENIEKYIARSIKGLNVFNEKLPLTVKTVKTRGKFCWIELENNWIIMIRFGMSGNIRPEPTEDYLEKYNKTQKRPVDAATFLKHCHLKICYCNEGNEGHFYYHDVRRFGSWTFTNDSQELEKILSKLGHDPLTEPALSDADAVALFRKWNNENVCRALMSQEMIAGVGNYIKSSCLYGARIHPLAQISKIPDGDIVNLYKEIRTIASDAYANGGASLYTYTGLNGDRSPFKDTLKIYNKARDPLGNPVKKIIETMSPDRRTTFWVEEIQTIGI